LVFPGSVQELEALKRRVMETGQAARQEVAAGAPGEKMEFYDLSVNPSSTIPATSWASLAQLLIYLGKSGLRKHCEYWFPKKRY
jgi:hypothetical protein